jgi:hypothetical protein
MNLWVPHAIDNAMLFSAAALFVLGIIFWLEFVRMARPVLTVFMAAVGAVFGYFLPLLWHTQLADLTLVIMGMVVGLILGAVLFRLTQALLFGALTALLCGGILAWHDGVFTPAADHTAKHSLQPRIHATRLPATAPTTHPAATRPLDVRRRIINDVHQQYQILVADQSRLNKSEKAQIMAAAAGGLLVVVLLGLLFPRAVSLLGGAWLGAAMIIWAVAVFTRRFDPGMLKMLGRYVRPVWIYGGLGMLGMAVQARQVLKFRKQKKKQADAADEKEKKKKK